MKNNRLKIPNILLAIFGLWFASSHIAHAEIITNLLGLEGFSVIIAQFLANLFNTIQMVASWILAMSGFLLNYSINLTLQMKAFLEQTPAVYITWKALRDISGLFIIFFLLYAAIKLILGLQDAKFGGLIKNIVIAGVLINFSFFFTSIGIDISNIVSIQLYNAIAPANTLNAGNLSATGITSTIGDGGLSDVFMKSLKIPALYDTSKSLTSAGQAAIAGGVWSAPIKVILISTASIIIILTAALSFAAAALAFVIRFVVLIFLLAFSPIWFASHIVPEIAEYAKKWTNAYKGMLIFMPVYLLLMYLAMNVMTTSPFLNGGDLNVAAAAAGAGATWYSSILSLSINGVIIITLLNLPLIAAISVGGGVVKFANSTVLGTAKFIRNNTLGAAGTRIIGGAANGLDKWAAGTKVGNSLIVRDLRSATTGALSKAKFGTSRSYEDLNKINKEIDKKNREISRVNNINDLVKNHAPLADISKAIKEMNDKEKLALGAEALAKKEIVAHLKESDFEAIKKSEEFDDDEKKAISKARTEALEDAVAREDSDTVKHMVNNMNGKDLLGMNSAKAGVITKDVLTPHLKQSQLKTLDDEGLDMEAKKEIAKGILKTGPTHKSYGFIKKNGASWGVEEELEKMKKEKEDKNKEPVIVAAASSPNQPKFSKSYGETPDSTKKTSETNVKKEENKTNDKSDKENTVFIPGNYIKKQGQSNIITPSTSPNAPKFSKTYNPENTDKLQNKPPINLSLPNNPPIISPPKPPEFGNN